MSKCIVNFSSGLYLKGQQRLRESLQTHAPDIPFLAYSDYSEIGSPDHGSCNYCFKIYAIEKALEQGYKQILWLDASIYAVKDITSVWEWIDKYGYFMEEAGHYVHDWVNQDALDHFNLTREQVYQWPMFAAGYVGFDFNKPETNLFFERWKTAANSGVFNGSWSDFRHDLTVGSIIANQIQFKYSVGGTYFSYVGSGFGTPKDTACFYLQGLV